MQGRRNPEEYQNQRSCSCSVAAKLVFPCSGASDVAGFEGFQHLKLAEMGFKAFRWRA